MPAAPLVPQVVPVLFGKYDSKTAPRLAQQGTFVELTNLLQTQTGRLQKRPGYAALPKPAGMTSGKRLLPYGSSLLAMTATDLWTYAPSTKAWTDVGTWSYPFATASAVLSNSNSQTITDCAVGGGMICYVWHDTRGVLSGYNSLRVSVHDATTGAPILADAQLDSVLAANEFNVQVVYTKGRFCIVMNSNGNLLIKTIATSAPTVVNTSSLSGTMIATAFDLFVQQQTGNVVIARNTSSVSSLYVWDPAADVQLATAEIDGSMGGGGSGFGVDGVGFLSHDNSDGRFYLAYADHVTGTWRTKIGAFDNALNFLAYADVEDRAGAGTSAASQLTGWVDTSTSPVTAHVLYQVDDSSGSSLLTRVHHGTWSVAVAGGGATSHAVLKRSVGLHSRAWLRSGVPYVILTYQGGQAGVITNTQETYFAARADTGQIIAKVLSGLGSGLRAQSYSLTSVPALAADEYVFSCGQKVQTAVESGSPVIVRSLTRVVVDFAPAIGLPRQSANLAVLPGGQVRMHDGSVSVPELGFDIFPEQPSGAGTGSGVMTGTYKYVQVYGWFDAAGQLHRSAPSPAVSVPVGTSKNCNVTYWMARLTDKSNVFIELYRQNPGADTNYYRITPTIGPPVNDPTVDSAVFLDTTADSEAATHEILYTTGGILQNDAPPPARLVAAIRDRIWVAACDTVGKIWPSKSIVPGQAPAFSADFEIDLDPVDGEVTAIEGLDDKIIIFCAGAIYWLSGDGPDNRGVGDFSSLTRLPGGVGCSNPASIVVTNLGLRFASSNSGGIYQLDRGLGLTYLGADVEAQNGLTVTGAVLMPEVNQTRFATAEGTTLVRDDYHSIWSLWTNQAAMAACRYDGLYTFLASDGTVYQETPGSYGDNGTPIRARFTLAWLSPFQPGGWGRLWRMHLVGDYSGPHRVRVGLRYDHQDAILWEELQVDAASACTDAAFGVATPYGTGDYGGANPGDYRWEVVPARQRCSAVQVVVEDVISDGSLSAGLDLSAIALLVGMQPNSLAKLPAARQLVTQ